jgi:predicted RNase H-like nuclease (RuvC/YqgF family)
MVVANYVAASRKQVNGLEQQITDLKEKEAVLNRHVQESASQFIEIAHITQQVERLIESKQSYLRTLDEARYLIDLRMKFDSLNSELQQLSQNIPEIKKITDQRRWITIVKSSRELDSLRLSAMPWIAKYGKDKVAIYKTGNGFYALAVLTDGSFTKAYRLTVDLMKTGEARDAYFDDSADWGPNIL